jgi:hypothetical protein
MGFVGLVGISLNSLELHEAAILLLAAVLFIRWFTQRRDSRGLPIPSQTPLFALLLSPLLIILWASLNFGLDRGAPPGVFTWRSIVLTGLLGLHLFAVVWVFYKLRRWPWFAIPLTVLSLLWAAMAWLTGAMALVDDWL